MNSMNKKFIFFLLAAFAWMTVSPAASLFAGPLDDGKKIYNQYCAQCHGDSGKGDGANEEFMDPPARDFTDTVDKVYFATITNKQIFDVISKGGKYTPKVNTFMPTFGISLSEYEIWTTVAYVRTLHPNKAPAVSFSGLSKERPKINIKQISVGEISKKERKDGKKTVKKYGCRGCHKIGKKKKGAESGGLLNGIKAKLSPQEIFSKIKDPRSVMKNSKNKESKMAAANINDEDALLITKYLLTLK
ncbi:MAG TPA: c-type cytochrome [Nitrospinota bacterium]|nr:c-type cytochrome [Nitrospinota bacterium]